MKFTQALALLAFATHTINAASLPESSDTLTTDVLAIRDAPYAPDHTLERRKGGGGRGGGGGGGGRSGGGGVSRTSPQSASGGATRQGSGPSRSYGGGRYYGGGAVVPYSSGGRSPKGLVPGALIAPALVLAVMPGIWLYSVYPYYYNNPYRFYNASRRNITRREEPNTSLPVLCLCQEFQVCGCDENDDTAYLNDLVGDGNYAALNKSLVTVSNINGTDTLVLNGSLPNGTTAPGGTDDEGAAVNLAIGKYAGYWAMGLVVLYGVML